MIFSWNIFFHSSEIRGFYARWNCLAKWFKICHIFRIRKTRWLVFSFFILSNFGFVTVYNVDIDRGITIENPKFLEILFGVFLLKKYGNFLSVLLHNFIKHKPPISEECDASSMMYVSTITCFILQWVYFRYSSWRFFSVWSKCTLHVRWRLKYQICSVN